MSDVLPFSAPAPRDPAAQDAARLRAEYGALRAGALLVDHSARRLWTFRGAGARDTVAGLVTNDVVGLAPGHGCYAAALTPKGRIIAVDIDPSLLQPSEKQMLEDLVAAAFNDARAKADAASGEEMSKMSAGIPLPPGFKLPF